jgi:hypothetical protein
MSGSTASNLLVVCGAEATTFMWSALKRQTLNLRPTAATARQEERNLTQRRTEASAMVKNNWKGEEHNELQLIL